ncbi:MAG TPA: hypothetical protein VNI60_05325 [Pyrinomonadaceae bacterium]|jgi:hypothetical protein|nr:hypothetical protein [Pyrinomonadaceae bacterium]
MKFVRRVMMQMSLVREDFHPFKYFGHDNKKMQVGGWKLLKWNEF